MARYSEEMNRDEVAITMPTFVLTEAAYGAWHCIAWNYHFPTNIEKILWRACGLAITAFNPFIWIMVPAALATLLNIRTFVRLPALLAQVIYLVPWLSYPPLRGFLILECLISLRKLPSSAFEDAQWTKYIPHF